MTVCSWRPWRYLRGIIQICTFTYTPTWQSARKGEESRHTQLRIWKGRLQDSRYVKFIAISTGVDRNLFTNIKWAKHICAALPLPSKWCQKRVGFVVKSLETRPLWAIQGTNIGWPCMGEVWWMLHEAGCVCTHPHSYNIKGIVNLQSDRKPISGTTKPQLPRFWTNSSRDCM